MPPRHLYVHVPFCARRCSYCDFAIAVRRTVPVDEYLSGLRSEVEVRFGGAVSGAWRLDSLYFGGGTPSLLGGEGIARAITELRTCARLDRDAEVTLEANPDDVTPDAAEMWAAAGVNRLSLGVQSFEPGVLAWMHRSHTVDRVGPAVAALRAAGLTDFSVDLIFSLPTALARDWRRDLDLALALEPTHVSLYGLTIEQRTPLARWRERGEVIEAPEERYAEEFLLAHEVMSAAGFEHYEVSNFGRPGHRARHNQAYWHGAAYAGIGPGAHEFDGGARRWNTGAYAEWLRRLRAGADPVEGSETLTSDNREAEAVYLGLRTVAGLELRDGEGAHVQPWIEAGWGTIDGDRLELTPQGWLRLDSLAARLTLLRSH